MDSADWIPTRDFYAFLMAKAEDRGNPLNVVPAIKRFGEQGTLLFRAGKARFFLGGRFIQVKRDWDVPPQVFTGKTFEDEFDPFLGTLYARDVSKDVIDKDLGPLDMLLSPERLSLRLDHLLLNLHDARSIGFTSGAEPVPTEAISISQKPKRAPGAGARTDSLRWEMMAAAFAKLAEDGEFEGLRSENKFHEKVAGFLAERGHDDALGIDSIRRMIRRYQAWSANKPFVDDADYEDG